MRYLHATNEDVMQIPHVEEREDDVFDRRVWRIRCDF